MNKLIGFTGYKGSGKTTAALHLTELGWYRESFATGIKDMLRAIGVDEHALTEGKEKECKILCGETPRRAMQTLGTEWGRVAIHPDIWVEAMRFRLKDLHHATRVVIDDVRFPNEVKFIQEIGGIIIHISIEQGTAHRFQNRSRDDHASESEIADLPYDYILHNSSTIDQLKRLAANLAVQ